MNRRTFAIWLAACALLLLATLVMGETPPTPALLDRLARRSAKARVARTALAVQAEQAHGLTFAPPGGYYDHDVRLELRSAAGAVIVFTVDGSVPTSTVGVVYQQPIYLDSRLPGVTVVRARQVFEDGQWGPVVSASFVMGVQARLPVLSMIVDPADLAAMEKHELARGGEWERPAHLTYITPDKQTGFAAPAGARIYSDGLRPLPKKTFRLYFRREYGQAQLDYALFPDARSFDRLVLDASRAAGDAQADQVWRWTLLENFVTDSLMRQVNGYAPGEQYVLLFLNGQPWGIYNLRERIDRFFLQDRFNIQSADVIQNRQAQEGDTQDWEALLDFVQNNSLADPRNMAFVQARLDLANFTDYVIVQLYAADPGWPQRNAVRARSRAPDGRWFWLAWDATRGYGATGQPDFNAVEWATRAYALDPHEGGSWLRSTLLLRSLLQNNAYRAAFIARAADLLNTTLSPDAVSSLVDVGAAQLEQDIGYEENRWPGPLGWRENVLALRAWVRARPDQMRRELMSKFDIAQTWVLEFAPPVEGQGYLVVNGQPLRALPWRGVYFDASQAAVAAVPAPGYTFAGWSAPELPAAPQITLTVRGAQTLAPRFAPAPPEALRPNDAIFNEVWINDHGTSYASLEGRAIEGDWFEILVVRDGLDMRGWRITDNDTKTASDEGSLIFPRAEAFTALPRGTVILVIAAESESNALNFPRDDVDAADGRMILYVGNGTLDTSSDAGFGLGRSNDNLVLLAPGPTDSFVDDIGIDFVAEGSAVTPASFGVLTDGVVFEHPFRRLSVDNGCVFTLNRIAGRAPFDNDDGSDSQVGDNQPGPGGWMVDPGPQYTGDDVLPNATNILTPGRLNPGQARELRGWLFWLWR